MKPLPLGLLIVGALLALGAPLLGIVGTVVSMIAAFNHLGNSGISDPHVLANDVGHGLVTATAGLVVAVALGLPLIIAGLALHFVGRRRASSEATISRAS